ncbi:MAG: hypothetical protein M3R38_23545 [Actinomycetota bacterium]|nr:hypothetical protein [Actinomycetota bacterium]
MGTRAVGDGGWTRDYVLLTLRTAKAVEARTGDGWMLDYYGPPEWKALVEAEEPRAGGALVEGVRELEESLSGEGFEARRTRYLGKHLLALETVARRLAGERLSLEEQAAGCFDIDVGWVPETTFGAAHALYDEALPGGGDVQERLRRWKVRHELPREMAALLPELVERAAREGRRRTEAIVGLPEGEEVSFGPMTGQPALATVEYLGDLRSRITVNADWAFNLADLLYVACHEGYPGHLAELVLKERHLAKEKGYVEELVTFTPTPSLVVMEGLALWAREVAFPGDEAQAWLEENVYPEAGIRPDGSDLQKIHAAKDMLWGAQCNAALMLAEGRPPEEAARYLERWALLDEEEASRSIPPMLRPFAEAYIFCYHHGRELLEDGMRGPGRDDFVRSLLTEQVCPSDLRLG